MSDEDSYPTCEDRRYMRLLLAVTVHIVLDDFGAASRVYRETDEAGAGRGDVVGDLLTGQFNNPLRVIAFNTAEGWSRDVSEDSVGIDAARDRRSEAAHRADAGLVET